MKIIEWMVVVERDFPKMQYYQSPSAIPEIRKARLRL